MFLPLILVGAQDAKPAKPAPRPLVAETGKVEAMAKPPEKGGPTLPQDRAEELNRRKAQVDMLAKEAQQKKRLALHPSKTTIDQSSHIHLGITIPS
ncbi:MAG: hypothetical protein IPI84_13245 [Holophagaceae bacterium]|nr:hypothetical protein [Holophagaceae bacterium]